MIYIPAIMIREPVYRFDDRAPGTFVDVILSFEREFSYTTLILFNNNQFFSERLVFIDESSKPLR